MQTNTGTDTDIPPVKYNPATKYQFDKVTIGRPLVLIVPSRKERLKVAQAAGVYFRRRGVAFATRSEMLPDGSVRVVIYRRIDGANNA